MRGTTPTEYVHIPESIDAEDIVQIYFTVSQDKRVIIDKDISDATRSGQVFAFKLTQKETLALNEDIEAEVQARWLMSDGEAYKSQTWVVNPGYLIKDGEITAPEETNEL